jgi:CcmD family protein
MEHLGYLAAAYSVFFVAIFLYVVFLWRRQRALEAELRALEARLKSREGGGVAGVSEPPARG